VTGWGWHDCSLFLVEKDLFFLTNHLAAWELGVPRGERLSFTAITAITARTPLFYENTNILSAIIAFNLINTASLRIVIGLILCSFFSFF